MGNCGLVLRPSYVAGDGEIIPLEDGPFFGRLDVVAMGDDAGLTFEGPGLFFDG